MYVCIISIAFKILRELNVAAITCMHVSVKGMYVCILILKALNSIF